MRTLLFIITCGIVTFITSKTGMELWYDLKAFIAARRGQEGFHARYQTYITVVYYIIMMFCTMALVVLSYKMVYSLIENGMI
jgi:hypothetical protein